MDSNYMKERMKKKMSDELKSNSFKIEKKDISDYHIDDQWILKPRNQNEFMVPEPDKTKSEDFLDNYTKKLEELSASIEKFTYPNSDNIDPDGTSAVPESPGPPIYEYEEINKEVDLILHEEIDAQMLVSDMLSDLGLDDGVDGIDIGSLSFDTMARLVSNSEIVSDETNFHESNTLHDIILASSMLATYYKINKGYLGTKNPTVLAELMKSIANDYMYTRLKYKLLDYCKKYHNSNIPEKWEDYIDSVYDEYIELSRKLIGFTKFINKVDSLVYGTNDGIDGNNDGDEERKKGGESVRKFRQEDTNNDFLGMLLDNHQLLRQEYHNQITGVLGVPSDYMGTQKLDEQKNSSAFISELYNWCKS